MHPMNIVIHHLYEILSIAWNKVILGVNLDIYIQKALITQKRRRIGTLFIAKFFQPEPYKNTIVPSRFLGPRI